MAAATLHLIDGRLLLEVIDPDGEAVAYAISRTPDGLDRWACLVGRDGGEARRVALSMGGAWRCSCPDMIYSRRRHRSRERGEPCKHIEAVAPLYAALCGLLGLPQEKANAAHPRPVVG